MGDVMSNVFLFVSSPDHKELLEQFQEVLQAAQELPSVAQQLHEIHEMINTNRVHLLPLTRVQKEALQALFKCSLCWGAYAS